MDSELLAWLDEWRGATPRSRVLQGLVQALQEHTEAMSEALARPDLDLAFRAQEALRLAETGEDVPAEEVLALVEAILGRKVAP